jgi:membrane protein implicated in regulation of membrane protease activity
MILLGILFVAAALAGGALLFVGASSLDDTISIPLLGGSINLPPVALFIAGAASVLLLWLGWAMLRGGARRSSRQRREAKENARLAEEQRRRAAADERTRVDADGDRAPRDADGNLTVPEERHEGPRA